MLMNLSFPSTPESEWRLLREEANRLNKIVIALRAGDVDGAFAAVDAPEQGVPVQCRRIVTPIVRAAR
jgi:hypothetical protein